MLIFVQFVVLSSFTQFLHLPNIVTHSSYTKNYCNIKHTLLACLLSTGNRKIVPPTFMMLLFSCLDMTKLKHFFCKIGYWWLCQNWQMYFIFCWSHTTHRRTYVSLSDWLWRNTVFTGAKNVANKLEEKMKAVDLFLPIILSLNFC